MGGKSAGAIAWSLYVDLDRIDLDHVDLDHTDLVYMNVAKMALHVGLVVLLIATERYTDGDPPSDGDDVGMWNSPYLTERVSE